MRPILAAAALMKRSNDSVVPDIASRKDSSSPPEKAETIRCASRKFMGVPPAAPSPSPLFQQLSCGLEGLDAERVGGIEIQVELTLQRRDQLDMGERIPLLVVVLQQSPHVCGGRQLEYDAEHVL